MRKCQFIVCAIEILVLTGVAPAGALAQNDISVERGLYVSIIGGCHDCHTEGYSESGGKIDPLKAMKGNASIGWRGPWGVAYATNLRLKAYLRDEDGFVEDLREMDNSLPPMPWYNVRRCRKVIYALSIVTSCRWESRVNLFRCLRRSSQKHRILRLHHLLCLRISPACPVLRMDRDNI